MRTILKSVRKKKPPKNGRPTMPSLDFAGWAKIFGATPQEVEAAWNDLKRRNLAAMRQGKAKISAEAMTRAHSDVQRRLASHLSGYMLTENSYIVRRAGPPPGLPMILNTRILVEYIANYFRGGWGVAEIQRDLPQLTVEQIEAAIQYYLNHREEIERDIQRSIKIYEKNVRRQERLGIWEKFTNS
jgi:uncharacterized protein (DUF433 family)